MGSHALVLNASFEPLNVVTWQRALQLLFQGKVEVIEEWETEVHSVSLRIRLPSVLRLVNYIPLVGKKRIIRFSRANIFIRDHYKCQYCGKKGTKNQLTLDHVIPVVQGGKKIWENIVTSCKSCNQKKGGRTPDEAGMSLSRKPKEPKWLPGSTLEVGVTVAHDSWKVYLRPRRGG